MNKFLTSRIVALLCLALCGFESWAGTVTGQVQNASGGPLANGTFSFTLTAPATVAGTATVVTSSVNCYTDQNGNVVGEPNTLVLASLSVNLASGTLAAGTYFVRITYFDASGESFPSSESSITLAAQGTLNVTAPVKQPATASGYKVYISSSTGTETLQGNVTGTPGSWANFSQSTPLAAGSALPVSNTTACKIRFNDELTPSFVCYDVGLTGPTGANIPGFPQYWYLAGGSAGTVNLSQGTPQSNVCQGSGIVYPQAVLTLPPFNGTQTINGGLSLAGNVSTSARISSSHVGTTDAAFTAGPTTATVPADFLTTRFQTAQFAHSFADEGNWSPALAAGGYASFSAAPFFSLGVATNHYNGFQFFPTLSGAGTLTSLAGYISAPVINTSSAVTELDDFYVQDWSGTGSVTTHRGIFIGPLTKAGSNHGITDQAALNEFTGVTTFGVPATAPPSVIATGDSSCATGNSAGQLHIAGASAPTEQLRLGFDNTSLVGCIQAEIAGASFNPVSLQPNGGDVLIGTKTDCGQLLCLPGQFTSTLATGTPPFIVTSTTPVAHLTTVPATYNAAGTQQTAVHLVVDTCTLGTNCGITLSGAAAFTSATTYSCSCHDQTTPTNACNINQTGGGAITITGTGTDVIRYWCGGN